MGVLNITPDSFSDGGLYRDPAAAVAHAIQMERDGADLIDVGAMSTRPFGEPIEEAEEIERLSCLGEIIRTLSCPVSVDTVNLSTARYALEQGAAVINDVSGVFRPDMARLVREFGCGYIVMHRGGPRTEQDADYPNGVTADVGAFFDRMLSRLVREGISAESVCLDPGYGFSKNTADNLTLLRQAERLKRNGVCLLTALSRKRFVGAASGVEAPEERDAASAAAGVAAIQKGSDMLRVHNVKMAVACARMADAVYRCP